MVINAYAIVDISTILLYKFVKQSLVIHYVHRIVHLMGYFVVAPLDTIPLHKRLVQNVHQHIIGMVKLVHEIKHVKQTIIGTLIFNVVNLLSQNVELINNGMVLNAFAMNT